MAIDGGVGASKELAVAETKPPAASAGVANAPTASENAVTDVRKRFHPPRDEVECCRFK
ncbi:hypothetical protein GCM10012319_44350 [Comamonas sp. KCTC 72670]|nr:hypothetical protein GCM10012319_44350 [Comamonas sp. KCTC 72670]